MKNIYIYRHNDYAAIRAAYLRLKIPKEIPRVIPLKTMKLYFIGVDENLEEVYLLKYAIKKTILINILMGIGEIFNEEIYIIDLTRYDQWPIRLITKWIKGRILK